MEDLSGRELGPYRVLAPLGEGGMAAVFRAYQPSMDRDVALKVLPRHLAGDPQFTARFENEARLLARLQHPHILPVFDFGQAGGYAYIVMPLVEAGTLAQLLRGQPLPTWQICSVGAQIGRALDYAHGRGLLHRDVKPSNVLIDETCNCLLTDFGIAKLVEGAAKFTATGMLVGTPAYMSPEQGRGASLDRRSDIYSLGIILYELATGRVPFSAETPVAVIYKHAHDPLPPVESLNPRLPPALVRVLYKALAKNPEDRFATAGEMANALEGCRAALGWDKTEVEPIPAPLPEPAPGPTPPAPSPPRTPSPSPGPAPRPRLALAGFGGVVLLASVLGLLGVCGLLAAAPRLFGAVLGVDATRAPAAALTQAALSTERATSLAQTAAALLTSTALAGVTPPAPTPLPSTTPAPPTPTRPAPTATRPPVVVFSDDFEDSRSGWFTGTGDDYAVAYRGGSYSIEIDRFGFTNALQVVGYHDATRSNVHIAVTAREVDGIARWYGIVCHRQSSGAYYHLYTNRRGNYGISYFDGDRDIRLIAGTIPAGLLPDTRRVEADCAADGRLRLVVDGVEVADVVHKAHTTGSIGLIAASADYAPIEVHFDDLVVTELQ